MQASNPGGYLLHPHVLTLILILFGVVIIASGFAFRSGVRSKRPRSKQEEYDKHVGQLEKQAEKQLGKLSRGYFGYRWMSGCLAAIEVVGGAYFAITGSSLPHQPAHPTDPTGAQFTVATAIGFAIIVTSAIQNRVHPYAKAVELRFRHWNLDFTLDQAQNARVFGTPAAEIANVLILAIRDATRPFSDKPDQSVANGPPLFHAQQVEKRPPDSHDQSSADKEKMAPVEPTKKADQALDGSASQA